MACYPPQTEPCFVAPMRLEKWLQMGEDGPILGPKFPGGKMSET